MSVQIRPATIRDLDWLLPQIAEFAQFSNEIVPFDYDEDKLAADLTKLIQSHLVLIADHKRHGPIGVISGHVFPWPSNPKIRMLSEHLWWVEKPHRGSRAGLMLLEAFVAWGKENADRITFTLEAHSPVKENTLLRRGFKLAERCYTMGVNHGH